jgi:glyoxylase-like metal-dependent hydrolase (beta-lactamase superfamily II)
MRRIFKGLGFAFMAMLIAFAAFLAEAHWEIRRISPELPELAAIAAITDVPNGPVSLHYVNTATQRGGIGSSIGHPSFVLAWPDGRLFAIDVGMTPPAAMAFGKPMEMLLGAEPTETYGSLADQLGPAATDVRGVAFTHLHTDHTEGIAALCKAAGHAIAVFQAPWQATRGNYTPAPGRNAIETSGCAHSVALGGGPAFAVPGFPGLVAVGAGGHTPGSTIYFARVGPTVWVFSGDITNFRDALLENRPKATAYSLFVTPEAPARLEELRLWLVDLDARPEYTVVVSHDVDALAAIGPPAWTADE